MQTTYNLSQDVAVIGQLADAADMNKSAVLSGVAYGEALPFGRGLVIQAGSNYVDGYKVALPKVDDVVNDEVAVVISMRDITKVGSIFADKDTIPMVVQSKVWVETEEEVTQGDVDSGEVWVRTDGVKEIYTITLDGDLVALNIIAATVNGVELSETYAVSHDATMQAFADKIAAVAGIESATLEGGDNRIITITADTKGEIITVTDESITLGVGQAGIEVAKATAGIAYANRGIFRKSEDETNAGTSAQVTNMKWLAPHDSGMALAVVTSPLV